MTDDQPLLIPAEWEAGSGRKPMTVDQAKKELDIGYPHVKAETLKGDTFVIRGARQFESTLSPDNNPFFCLCLDEETGELFTVVIGGRQPVEFLSAYMAKGAERPLRVTLRFQEGGKFDGYYVLE